MIFLSVYAAFYSIQEQRITFYQKFLEVAKPTKHCSNFMIGLVGLKNNSFYRKTMFFHLLSK